MNNNHRMDATLQWLDERINVSVFHSCKSNEVETGMSLWTFLQDDNVGQLGVNRRDMVDAVRRETNEAARKELKKRLPAATLAGQFESRRERARMLSSTGLLCIDMDGKDNQHITECQWWQIAAELLEMGQVAYFGNSVSGNGYFALFAIAKPTLNPPSDYGQFYSRAYEYVSNQLRELYGVVCDPACKDVKRLRTLSYDDNAGCNLCPEVVPLPAEVINPRPQVPKNLPPLCLAEPGAYGDTYDRAAAIVADLCRAGVNMVDTYDDWYKIGFALADLGEPGRPLYHQLSQMSPKYKQWETDKKFDNCLQSRNGSINIGTFFHAAQYYGL